MDDDLDQLRRRLRQEGAGPMTDLSNRTMSAISARLRAFTQWVREQGEERPLISILFALQFGFAIGHWGRRRAKR